MGAQRHPGLMPVAGRPRLVIAVTDSMALLLLRGQLAAARERGFEVTVLSSPGELAARVSAAEGVRHVAVAMERGIAPGSDLASLAGLVRVLRQIRPHLVDASTPKAGLLVLQAAWLTGVPCRVHTLHGLRFETTAGRTRALLMAMTRLTCAMAQRVICVSPSLRRRALQHRVVRAEQAIVLGAGSSNGVDLERFAPTDALQAQAREVRRELGIAPDAPVIGSVGRLARDKGVLELAAAWRVWRGRYPGAHLLVIGPPEPTDMVPQALLDELAADARVHLLGHREDLDVLYAAMDVLAMPTYREGFGNVLIEAAAMELPAVATRVTGCVDAVDDGATGTLVPARDAPALVEAVARYLDSPALRRQHGRAGRERAARLFERRGVWTRLHTEYVRLLDTAGVTLDPALVPALAALRAQPCAR